MKSRMAAAVALTAVAASGCGVGVRFADYRHRMVPPDAHITDPVGVIEVNTGSGHVNVTTGGAGVTVHRVVRYGRGTPRPGHRVDTGTLTFTNGCSRCSIDYDLTVPASVRVRVRGGSGPVDVAGVTSADVRIDSGSVTVRHVKGDVRAHSDSGAVTVEDVGGTLDTGTDSGSIDARVLRSARVRASSDSGDIRLGFTIPPADVHATTDSGSLRVRVPGGPYRLDARTDSGGKDVSRVATDPAARSLLYLRTDSGHLTVEPT